ncbi:TetR/AcrR family transcriptional regulator [Streptomyces sp. NPDC054933]
MARTEKARFTAADWTGAALAAMARGGVRAVKVEALAAELGASKGGFYWFFANREALVTAALEQWLRGSTDRVREELEGLATPEEQLRQLLRTAFAEAPGRGLEVALQADVDSPEVRGFLAEADRRRVAIIRALLVAAGHPAKTADRTALSGYAAYLGFLQLQRTDPGLVPSGPARDAYLESLLHALLPPNR